MTVLRGILIVLTAAAAGSCLAALTVLGDVRFAGPAFPFAVIGTALVALGHSYVSEASVSWRSSYAIAVIFGAPLGAALLLLILPPTLWTAILGATFGLSCAIVWGAMDMLLPRPPAT